MMLTEREIKLVLAAAMAYDNRKPGEANTAAWSEAANRGRWSFPEALEAVHQHYAERSEWLMPGMVTQAIRAARQDTAMRGPQEPTPDPIGQARLRELVSGAFHAITGGDSDATHAARDGVLLRPCPYCHAKSGQHCTRRGLTGRVRIGKVHPSRLEVRGRCEPETGAAP